MGDVVSYGGDLEIVATRGEIDRVQQNLAAVGLLLSQQLEPTDFMHLPLKRVGLALEFPALNDRLQYLLRACEAAANEYFDGEALISQRVLGVSIAPLAAFGLLAFGSRFGLFGEGAAVARQVGFSKPAWPPLSIESLLVRLSHTGVGGKPQVRIEKFGNRFLVYVPGTQSWNPFSTANPLDITSNLGAMVGANRAASELGVQQALIKAGVKSNDRVLFVGHSQGGLIAANIAANAQKQNYKVAGLITFGSPLGQLANQIKVPTIALEHSNDLVPKLALKANPLMANWVTVIREAKTEDGIGALADAHELGEYQKTAQLADKSQDVGVQRVREILLNEISGGVKPTESESGSMQTYLIERK